LLHKTVKVEVSLEQARKAQWESRALPLLYKLGTSWGMGGQCYTLATFPGQEAQNPLYNVKKLHKIWGGGDPKSTIMEVTNIVRPLV